MRRDGYFTKLNKITIVECKVTIKLLLVCHYCDKDEYSHVIFCGYYFMIIVRTYLKADPLSL